MKEFNLNVARDVKEALIFHAEAMIEIEKAIVNLCGYMPSKATEIVEDVIHRTRYVEETKNNTFISESLKARIIEEMNEAINKQLIDEADKNEK